MMKKGSKIYMALAFGALLIGGVSCDENRSYSELLESENKAVNWYLSNFRVEPGIPADSSFKVGKDAPFYRMNNDGTVYMRVVNPGDMSDRPKKGDKVYFLFMRSDINYMYNNGTLDANASGNAEDMNSSAAGTNLIYGNQVLSSTTQYGTGLQVPLDYLGYNCEVDLIVKSVEGFTASMSECIPYVFNIRYFKAEY